MSKYYDKVEEAIKFLEFTVFMSFGPTHKKLNTSRIY